MEILKISPSNHLCLLVINPINTKKMMKENMVKSSTTLIILLLISLTTPLTSALKRCLSQAKSELTIHELAARDAITISIQQIRETTQFISSIPQLKRLSLTEPDPMLMLCVEHLTSDVSDINFTLHRLRHLKFRFLESGTISVKRMMGRSLRLGKMCSKSVKNVNEIVLLMLTRKLVDLSVVVDDVVYRVSAIEREENHCETVEKP